ncbi:Uncharacterized protein Fot_16140 [Forsythia ovata]|uniref:Uncharacterized protein n=1 Tax=Forsythia ovata TaxID=205694 RepID=A0ABD1WBE8_9LAMI
MHTELSSKDPFVGGTNDKLLEWKFDSRDFLGETVLDKISLEEVLHVNFARTDTLLVEVLHDLIKTKVNCIESENALLENRHKELKETINNLLQSRESFVKAYEDSTYEMKRAMESRDRMILFLSEKIKAHSLLVNAIEKEASSIKQIVNYTQCILNEKEEVGK